MLFLALVVVGGCSQTGTRHAAPAVDPLPSWAEGPTKSAIVGFVQDVTTQDDPSYVPPEQRIATFDQDGTLWCEQPVAQLEFVTWRIQQLAPEHPEWKEEQPFKALLEGDKDFLLDDLTNNHGKKAMELMVTTHAGMPIDEFDRNVAQFLETSRHPKYSRKYTETIYQPMLELLRYLRAHGFKTYICSGGGKAFMRVFTEETYGVVPENVIGSIPIFVGGNVRTGGDIGQLTYSHTNELPSFQLLINHDDDAREFAYSEDDSASLSAAREQGWHVVSMKNDWTRVFPFE